MTWSTKNYIVYMCAVKCRIPFSCKFNSKAFVQLLFFFLFLNG